MSDWISVVEAAYSLEGDLVSWTSQVLTVWGRGLSRREAQVAEFLARGYSEKEIAGTLGLSASAVSRRISSAARKLGLRSRVEVAATFASLGLAVAERRLTVDTGASQSLLPLGALSPAEREVAALATRGRSDAEIAVARGASRRTIENQLAAVYRKLGVHSRTELAARLNA